MSQSRSNIQNKQGGKKMNANRCSRLVYGFTVTAVLLLTVSLTAVSTPQTAALSLQEATQTCDTVYTLDDADPNESAEVVQAYWNGIELMRQGRWDEARSWFADSVSRYHNSRHLHEGLAQVLWYLAISGPEDSAVLEYAAREVVRAVEIGLEFDKVRHTWLLAQILGRTGDINTLDSLFERMLAIAPTFETYLHYALGLSLLGDPKAEAVYHQAIELQPEGNVDALAFYAEWLLDQRREREVLNLLPSDTHFEYLHFLRGVAWERLGHLERAKTEYVWFVLFSHDFPAPKRYQIPNSLAQSGIRFEGDVSITATDSQARVGLSTLIYGEAGGESSGGQRAIGWVVRNRVLRGSVGSPPCPYVNNSGATLADKYKSVMCQSGQFAGMCSAWCSNPSTTTCPHSPTTDHNAYDVWYGYAPDPVPLVGNGYCPGGFNYSTCYGSYCPPCDSHVHCNGGTSGYSTAGGLFNLGIYSVNPMDCPNHSCAPTNRRMVCSDGYAPNNCFYTNP